MNGPTLVICSSISKSLDRTVARHAGRVTLLAKAAQRLARRFPGLPIIEADGDGAWTKKMVGGVVGETIARLAPEVIVIVYRDEALAGGYENVEDMAIALARATGARLEAAGRERSVVPVSSASLRLRRWPRRMVEVGGLTVLALAMPLIVTFFHAVAWRETRRVRMVLSRAGGVGGSHRERRS